MEKKPATNLKAAIIDMDPMVSKICEVLVKQNGYDATSFATSQLDIRHIKLCAKNLMIFNVDILEDKDLYATRMKMFRELLRCDELSHAKIIITSSTPEDPKVKSLISVNKLDSLIKIPIDAMEFTQILIELKKSDPKRTVWRSSWK